MKQVIVIRKDLGMRCGKMVTQGAHASLDVILNLGKFDSQHDNVLVIPLSEDIKTWLNEGYRKITCRVESEQELLDIYEQIKQTNIPVSLIKDWGLTELKEPTYTALAIGPAQDEEIDKFTKHLPLL
jgi:PTH2 family peptidyl-tRNA hydrolase